MKDLLLVYVTCDSVKEAKRMGKHLMNKRLCACVNIFPEMQPMFFWPPKKNKIDESKEVVMIVKTIEDKYKKLESEISKIHTYDVPCIIAIPTKYVSQKYYDWLIGELDEPVK
ncbi:divalent-cation tolerance protein CutA [Patescibacteria group bacterium]